MFKILIGAVIAAIIGTGGVIYYVYNQGIKVSENVCQEDKLRQELADKDEALRIQKELADFGHQLIDEANKSLENEQLQVLKLEEKIDELRKNQKSSGDNTYQCIPDSVLEELRKLRLLR